MEQVQLPGIWLSEAEDFPFNVFLVRMELIDMRQAFLEFSGLFTGYSPVNDGLDFSDFLMSSAELTD